MKTERNLGLPRAMSNFVSAWYNSVPIPYPLKRIYYVPYKNELTVENFERITNLLYHPTSRLSLAISHSPSDVSLVIAQRQGSS
jgi:hypothetical protein